jgi:hypothetical protein
MTKAKVIVDFSPNRYTDIKLSQKAAYIVLCLLNNPNFLELAEEVLAMQLKKNAFHVLLTKKQERSKQQTVEKKSLRAELESILSSTGGRVQTLSGDNELLILNAGYDVKRKGAPIGMLAMPTNLTANPGAAHGSLAMKWDSVARASMYELLYTTAPSTPDIVWIHISTTRHKLTLSNLTRGQAYAIKVAAAGTDPRRVWSDEIISYVM